MEKETIAAKSDFRVDYYLSSKNGGQRGDKKRTAVRITHIPSGLSACCEDERYQHLNKIKAFKRLGDKVVEWWKKNNDSVSQQYRSDKEVRVYNEKRGSVKDSDTGVVRDYKMTLNGNYLDDFMQARLKRELDENTSSKQENA